MHSKLICSIGRFQLQIVGIAIMTEIFVSCNSLSAENLRLCQKIDPELP
jgi:hypothetical protein